MDSSSPPNMSLHWTGSFALGQNRMNALQYALCVILSGLMISCDQQRQTVNIPAKTELPAEVYCGQCRPCRLHPGDVDDQGHLVVFEAAGLCKTLETDYALVLLNSGDPIQPVARYDLSSRESGYEAFTSLDSLIARIKRIPKPRVIDFYSTCGAPQYFELPKPEIDLFFDSMKSAMVELRTSRPDGGGNSICTCPCPRCK